MRSSWRSDVPLYLVSSAPLHLSLPRRSRGDIHASAVQAMLAGDVLPEGGTYLIALHHLSITCSLLSNGDSTGRYIRTGRFEDGPVDTRMVSGARVEGQGHCFPRASTYDLTHFRDFGGVAGVSGGEGVVGGVGYRKGLSGWRGGVVEGVGGGRAVKAGACRVLF